MPFERLQQQSTMQYIVAPGVTKDELPADRTPTLQTVANSSIRAGQE